MTNITIIIFTIDHNNDNKLHKVNNKSNHNNKSYIYIYFFFLTFTVPNDSPSLSSLPGLKEEKSWALALAAEFKRASPSKGAVVGKGAMGSL
jgi:hypothetical protein